jgi:hypothetical protein
MDSFLKKRTTTKNKIHGEEVLGVSLSWVYCSLNRDKKYLEKKLNGIEGKLLFLLKQDQ